MIWVRSQQFIYSAYHFKLNSKLLQLLGEFRVDVFWRCVDKSSIWVCSKGPPWLPLSSLKNTHTLLHPLPLSSACTCAPRLDLASLFVRFFWASKLLMMDQRLLHQIKSSLPYHRKTKKPNKTIDTGIVQSAITHGIDFFCECTIGSDLSASKWSEEWFNTVPLRGMHCGLWACRVVTVWKWKTKRLPQ